jgi:hypothetical protein
MNTRVDRIENVVPDPHPCSLNTNNISKEDLDKDYENLINCCQRHVCRLDGYCKSVKHGPNMCRFGYPFKIEDATRIEFKEEPNSKVIRAEICLKRNDPFLNMHNRLICHHWRGNVDMQIILDEAAAINYIVKYATKGEKAGQELTEIFKDVVLNSQNDEDPHKKLRSIMIKTICGKRDISQCEVSRLLLSEPLYHSSFEYITLNTDLNSRELNIDMNLDENEPATKKSIIDYYANRKKEFFLRTYLEQITSLVHFVRMFKLTRDNKLTYRQDCEKTVVITFPKIRYNPLNKENHIKYCYNQLIKYSNWSIDNIEDIKNEETAPQRWESFLATASDDVLKYVKFDRELSNQLLLARQEVVEPVNQPSVTRDDWMILSEIRPIMNEIDIDDVVPDANYDFLAHRNNYTPEELEQIENNWINRQKLMFIDITSFDEIPTVYPDQLNQKQRMAFDIVENFYLKKEQLLMIINGSASTGKSFTINAISCFLRNELKRCAPTAKAAYIIRGETIHSLFSIGTKIDKNIYQALNKSKLKELQDVFKAATHVIIDEYSMLSQTILAIIDKRLREATGKKNVYFGGISIILTGDTGQLPPVSRTCLFNSSPNNFMSIQGYDCYLQFNFVIFLDVSVRQQNLNNDPDQEQFIRVLARLRDGINDEETVNDWKFLLKRIVKPNLLEEFKDAIRLFLDNATCNQYNNDKLKQLKMPICKIQAINKPESARNYDEENFFGLRNVINLAINAKITLTSNLWTSKGLVNGANGIIRDIIFPVNTIERSWPSALLIEFDNYSGPRLFDINDHKYNWIPVNIFDAYCPLKNAHRLQFPIRLAYALTIHKSRGQTIAKTVINLGDKEQSLGLTFVALSRVKKFTDFLIEPFSLQQLQKLSQSKLLKPRLDDKRLKLLFQKTLEFYSNEIMQKT